MAVFKEAMARLFNGVYVCRGCEAKIRVPIGKVLAGKGVCRKCNCKNLRPVRSKSKK